MTKQQSSTGNKQSATDNDSKKSTTAEQPKSGKQAESHTKAGSDKGAGGGAKQARKH
jgi:hypothetical protein